MKTELLAPILLAVAALAAGCRNPSGDEGPATVGVPALAGPAPIVTGTVLDARTGKPVPGALVRGPDGVESKSDARGRFVLKGLALGVSGELVGTTTSGLTGKNRLRALEAGVLEVVLYLR